MSRFIRSKVEQVKTLPVIPQLALLLVLLLLIFAGAFHPDYLFQASTSEDIEEVRLPVTIPTGEGAADTEQQKPFGDVAITAKSAYVWDVAKQRALYKKDEAESLPLASLTKLMTALVAHEILSESDTITISEEAIKQDGASGLVAGETFDRLDLSDLMLISSSNDGAYALGYAAGAVLTTDDPANAFVQAMNIRAKEIGLTSTFFKNPTGLDISVTEGGAYGSARDIAFLMEYILEEAPVILSFTNREETDIYNTDGVVHETENTNYFVNEIPGIIASKTGYTDLAGGNLVVAFEAGLNRPIIIVVLGSTRQDRFSDVIALVNEAQTYVSHN